MKQKTTIYVILTAFILTAGLSGCLGNGMNHNSDYDYVNHNPDNNYANHNPGHNYEIDEADIRSVTMAVNGSDVIATVITELDFNEKLDTANITVSKLGNIVHVSIYSVEPAANIGSNVVDVKIGTVKEFNDGADYTLIINDENDRDERVAFRFENDSLVVFKTAFVQRVTFEANGNELYAVASIINVGAGDTVDEQNITKTRFDHENEMDIHVPLKIVSKAGTGNETISSRISLGQLNQLTDGRYSVEINDRDGYFTIRNGALVV